jgi:hypothetical protein
MPVAPGALGLFNVFDLVDVPAGFAGGRVDDGQIADLFFSSARAIGESMEM